MSFLFFFFKQKTAYEILRCLVGSEMCIRDSIHTVVPSVTACRGAGRSAQWRVMSSRSLRERQGWCMSWKLTPPTDMRFSPVVVSVPHGTLKNRL